MWRWVFLFDSSRSKSMATMEFSWGSEIQNKFSFVSLAALVDGFTFAHSKATWFSQTDGRTDSRTTGHAKKPKKYDFVRQLRFEICLTVCLSDLISLSARPSVCPRNPKKYLMFKAKDNVGRTVTVVWACATAFVQLCASIINDDDDSWRWKWWWWSWWWWLWPRMEGNNVYLLNNMLDKKNIICLFGLASYGLKWNEAE